MSRGRPATPLGTFGKIHTEKLDNGKWVASCYVKLSNGKRKRPTARGTSENKAISALKVKCKAIDTTAADTGALTTTSPLSVLMEQWIGRHDVSENTRNTYQSCIDLHISPGIGSIRLNELTTPIVQVFLDGLTPGTAHTARAALSSALGMAVRWGVMPTNVVRDTKLPKKKRRDPYVLTEDEILEYRDRITAWSGGNQYGPARGDGLLEIVDVCIGSAARIGEVLALRWEDVDLDAGTITISGTIDKDTGKRKDWPKTESSRRTITVTTIAVDALRRQWEKPSREILGEPVFPRRTGEWRSVDSVETRLRDARGDGMDHITPHAFRRTAATKIERRFGMLAASRYLGHSSTAVTEQAYVSRPEIIADYTSAFGVEVVAT